MRADRPMRVPFDLASRRRYLSPDFPDAEYDRRIAAVRAGMAARGLDALVVHATGSFATVRWLTNFEPVHGTAFVVVRGDGSLAVTTNGMLHGEPMHSMIWQCRVADVRCSLGTLYGAAADEVARLAADALAGARRVGLAGGAMMPRLYAAAFDSVELVAADDIVARARMLKSEAEIAAMAEAGRVAAAAIRAATDAVAPGVLETEVAAAAVATIHRLGGREAFRTCVVAGPQAGLKHAYPRPRPIGAGEMVFLDMGAEVRGYASDTSRCVVAGEACGAAADILALAAELHAAGLAVLRPGAGNDALAAALSAVVKASRYEPDYCQSGYGHGIGMDLLEAPGGLYEGAQVVFEPGMTLAFEPMIVREGLGTAVIEDTLVITDSGHRILTAA
jgi:Xaa-Pro aminopeptidase